MAALDVAPVIAPAVTGSIPLAINTTSNAVGATVLTISPALDIIPGITPPGDPGVYVRFFPGSAIGVVAPVLGSTWKK